MFNLHNNDPYSDYVSVHRYIESHNEACYENLYYNEMQTFQYDGETAFFIENQASADVCFETIAESLYKTAPFLEAINERSDNNSEFLQHDVNNQHEHEIQKYEFPLFTCFTCGYTPASWISGVESTYYICFFCGNKLEDD